MIWGPEMHVKSICTWGGGLTKIWISDFLPFCRHGAKTLLSHLTRFGDIWWIWWHTYCYSLTSIYFEKPDTFVHCYKSDPAIVTLLLVFTYCCVSYCWMYRAVLNCIDYILNNQTPLSLPGCSPGILRAGLILPAMQRNHKRGNWIIPSVLLLEAIFWN